MKKKRVGIITIMDKMNMGNRLQNYAVQELYQELGCNAVTLGRYGGNGELEHRIGLRYFNFYNLLLGIGSFLIRHKSRAFYFSKYNIHIKFGSRALKEKNLKWLEKRFDYFSVGSDQIWNPRFGFLSPIDLLTFSPRQKNLSLSASIGLDSLDGECDREFVKNALLNFAHISVRENRAKEIIEEMTGRNDIEVFLDPTLLLPKEKWEKVERGGVKCKEKYIFLFFLSEIRSKEGIYRFAEEKGYSIVEWSPGKKELFSKIGPSEWLYLIHHASYVCTDSFHACALSLVFNVPFTVYRRVSIENIYSRIETLIKTFSLEGVEENGVVTIPTIDFQRVNRKMSEERSRTLGILKEWLELN